MFQLIQQAQFGIKTNASWRGINTQSHHLITVLNIQQASTPGTDTTKSDRFIAAVKMQQQTPDKLQNGIYRQPVLFNQLLQF